MHIASKGMAEESLSALARALVHPAEAVRLRAWRAVSTFVAAKGAAFAPAPPPAPARKRRGGAAGEREKEGQACAPFAGAETAPAVGTQSRLLARALFSSLWLADPATPALADFPDRLAGLMQRDLWLWSAMWTEMRRQWSGVQTARMDKMFRLTRRMLSAEAVLFREGAARLLEESVFVDGTKKGYWEFPEKGVRLHIADVVVDEICRVDVAMREHAAAATATTTGKKAKKGKKGKTRSKEELDAGISTAEFFVAIAPFLRCLALTRDKAIINRIADRVVSYLLQLKTDEEQEHLPHVDILQMQIFLSALAAAPQTRQKNRRTVYTLHAMYRDTTGIQTADALAQSEATGVYTADALLDGSAMPRPRVSGSLESPRVRDRAQHQADPEEEEADADEQDQEPDPDEREQQEEQDEEQEPQQPAATARASSQARRSARRRTATQEQKQGQEQEQEPESQPSSSSSTSLSSASTSKQRGRKRKAQSENDVETTEEEAPAPPSVLDSSETSPSGSATATAPVSAVRRSRRSSRARAPPVRFDDGSLARDDSMDMPPDDQPAMIAVRSPVEVPVTTRSSKRRRGSRESSGAAIQEAIVTTPLDKTVLKMMQKSSQKASKAAATRAQKLAQSLEQDQQESDRRTKTAGGSAKRRVTRSQRAAGKTPSPRVRAVDLF